MDGINSYESMDEVFENNQQNRIKARCELEQSIGIFKETLVNFKKNQLKKIQQECSLVEKAFKVILDSKNFLWKSIRSGRSLVMMILIASTISFIAITILL